MDYTAKILENIKNAPGTWDSLKVGVYRGNELIGSYVRNYASLLDSFCAFERDGKEYALYSRDYTATRLMELPSCKDLGGEEPDGFGFCPVAFWVAPDAAFGLVSGCIWGDDSSWKLRYIDLSKVSEGKLDISDRFGYVELADSLPDDVVSYDPDDGGYLEVATAATTFHVTCGKSVVECACED